MHKFTISHGSGKLPDVNVTDNEGDKQWLLQEYLQHPSVSWFSHAQEIPLCVILIGERFAGSLMQAIHEYVSFAQTWHGNLLKGLYQTSPA
eukprot:scaffold487435_cov48-Prasinocladus_malaysianus.AAC.1